MAAWRAALLGIALASSGCAAIGDPEGVAATAAPQRGSGGSAADAAGPGADQAPAAAPGSQSGEARRVALDGLTLSDAVGIAISRHPSVAQANAVVSLGQSDVAIARAAWYPTLEYGVRPGYGRVYGDDRRALGASASLGVNQLIHDFGRTRNTVWAAEATLAQKRRLLDDAIEQVAYTCASTLVELAAAQDRHLAARRLAAGLQETRARIGERVRAGLSDATDQNLADVAIQRAAAEELKAQTQVEVARGRLADLLGVRPVRVASLAATRSFTIRLGAGRGDIENTPAVRAADAALNAATARVRVAEAERWPQIGLGLSRSVSTGPRNANDSAFVGVTIGGNFSLGGLASSRIAAAEAERNAAAHNLENQKLVTRTARGSAELEATGAAARTVSFEKAISLTRRQRALSWQEYTLNKRPLTDVINAERDIYQAETERLDAVADGVLARLKLHAAVGQLTPLLRDKAKGRD